MATRVEIRDNGADAMVRGVRKLSQKETSTDVGVIGDAAEGGRADAMTNAMLASIHEFGLGVPRRSWLRDWIGENESEISRQMREAVHRTVKQGMAPEQSMALFGAWAQGQIQQRIADGLEPPLAPSTIARKGSDVPLIDTGQLRSSITHRVNT